MSLTKTTSVDQITIEANGIVLYRELTRILEDGAEISAAYHRISLAPGQDLDGVPANVAAVCAVVWTKDIVDAYLEQVAPAA